MKQLWSLVPVVFAAALAITGVAARNQSLPPDPGEAELPPSAGSPIVREAYTQLSEAEARHERRFEDAIDPANALVEQKRQLEAAIKSGDGAALASLGRDLFARDHSQPSPKPLAETTRCASCHHRGGIGGAGGLVDDFFEGRNPPSLAGTALLERLGRELTKELASRAKQGLPLTVQGVSFGTKASPDGIAGDLVIRPFGRTGRWATLDETIRDMSLTTMRVELPPDERRAIAAFLETLPAPGFMPPDSVETPDLFARYLAGRRVFERVGCTQCHVAEWRLEDGTVVSAFTDFKRHDMGEGLASNGNREWQTPALWGLSASAPYLHNGHALTSLQTAILAHDGEAREVRTAYESLDKEDQRRLRVFLLSLAPLPQMRVAGQ